MAEKEYIELDAAIEAFDDPAVERNYGDVDPESVIHVIESIPAADVRHVVLCRDCKRYGGRPWENNESGICARTDVGVGEFDFCSYGEKREES